MRRYNFSVGQYLLTSARYGYSSCAMYLRLREPADTLHCIDTQSAYFSLQRYQVLLPMLIQWPSNVPSNVVGSKSSVCFFISTSEMFQGLGLGCLAIARILDSTGFWPEILVLIDSPLSSVHFVIHSVYKNAVGLIWRMFDAFGINVSLPPLVGKIYFSLRRTLHPFLSQSFNACTGYSVTNDAGRITPIKLIQSMRSDCIIHRSKRRLLPGASRHIRPFLPSRTALQLCHSTALRPNPRTWNACQAASHADCTPCWSNDWAAAYLTAPHICAALSPFNVAFSSFKQIIVQSAPVSCEAVEQQCSATSPSFWAFKSNRTLQTPSRAMHLRHRSLNLKLAVKVMDGHCLGKTYVCESPTRIATWSGSSAFHLNRTTLNQCGTHHQCSVAMVPTSTTSSAKAQQASNMSWVTTGAHDFDATQSARQQNFAKKR